jgi:hypothetical protein
LEAAPFQKAAATAAASGTGRREKDEMCRFRLLVGDGRRSRRPETEDKDDGGKQRRMQRSRDGERETGNVQRASARDAGKQRSWRNRDAGATLGDEQAAQPQRVSCRKHPVVPGEGTGLRAADPRRSRDFFQRVDVGQPVSAHPDSAEEAKALPTASRCFQAKTGAACARSGTLMSSA